MKKLFVVITIFLVIIMGNGCIFEPDDESKNADNNVTKPQNVAEQNTADQNVVEQDANNPPAAQQIENPIYLRVLIGRTDINGDFVSKFKGVTVWSNSALEDVDGVKTNAVNTDSEGAAILAFPEGTSWVKIHAECGWTERIVELDLSKNYVSLYLKIYPYENLIFLPVKVVKINSNGSAENYKGVTVWSNSALEYVDGLKTNAINTNSEGMATLVFHKYAGEVKIHAEFGWTEKILTVDISRQPDLLLVQIK